MEKEYQPLTKVNNNDDIGRCIQLLVEDNIKKINTSFLATVTAINGNKVSIKSLIKRKQTDKDTIFNNCLVGFPYSQKWQTQFKLHAGDVGIALVMQDDTTSYKNTGNGGINYTGRVQDKNDSIFIPLSLFKTLPNADVNYIIESFDKVCKIEFDKNNIGTLQAQLLTIKSENTTLKTKLSELASILEGALILQSSSGTQPFDSGTIANFSAWKSSLNDLFKD